MKYIFHFRSLFSHFGILAQIFLIFGLSFLQAETPRETGAHLDVAPLEKRAESGDSEAQTSLAILLISGQEVEKDESRGFYWLEKAAAMKDPRGTYYFSLCFLDGLGTKKDLARGRDLLQQAVEMNYPQAKMFLGKCFLDGRYEFKRDIQRAQELLLDAAEKEVPEAQYWLGVLYSGANRYRELKWLTLSASHGFVPAQLLLGREYLKTENAFWAQEWLGEAEEGGSAEAAWLLGINYLNGQAGFDEDPVEAVTHLQKAASGGWTEAQFLLAASYLESGSEVEAAQWLTDAAWSGHKEAEELLKKTDFSPETCERMGVHFFFDASDAQGLPKLLFWLKAGVQKKNDFCASKLYSLQCLGLDGTLDLKESLNLLEIGEENKAPLCMKELAWCFYLGRGVDKDFTKALALVHEMQNLPTPPKESWFIQGLCAFFGQGISRDRALAEECFRKAGGDCTFANAWLAFTAVHPIPDSAQTPEEVLALVRAAADSGEPAAQNLMGFLHEGGIWVPMDRKKAFECFSLAAKQGCAAAEVAMFWYLKFGIACEQDLTGAMRCLKSATEKGDPNGFRILDLMNP